MRTAAESTRAGFTPEQLRRLANQNGTPLYAYNGVGLRRSFEQLRTALPAEIGILYSMKANPHPEILKTIQRLGAGVDVASLGELEKAEAAGFKPSQISFVGPGKSDKELQAAIDRRLSCVVVESIEELDRIAGFASRAAQRTNVGIRVNPLQYIYNSGRAMSGVSSQFGIDEEKLPEVVERTRRYPVLKVTGLHFFVESQYLVADRLLRNFGRFLEIACDFQRKIGFALGNVNLGGGFGIPYYEDQSELDLAQIRGGLERLMNSPAAKELSPARFLVESGRFIVGPAGVFLTKILYRKLSRGVTYLVCDGGLNLHLSACGLTTRICRTFPIEFLTADPISAEREPETVTIVGPTSYHRDVLAADVRLPSPQPGDLICIGCSGAYGFTFSPRRFLSLDSGREIFADASVL